MKTIDHFKRYRRWFADGVFRAILRDAGYLGSSKVFAGLLGLAALAFASRGMSPAEFGTLAIVLAYTKGVSNLATFQTWHFIVRFGTPALTTRNLKRVRDVIGFSLGLDLASGVAALLAGMAALPFIANWVGVSTDNTLLALFYCTLIPLQTASTPTGVLRALDRFDLLSLQQLIKPLLRVVGGGLCLLFHWGFAGFIATWYLAQAVDTATGWAFTIYEFRRRRIRRALHPFLRRPRRKVPGAWEFVWTTNVGRSIWSIKDPGSNILIGIVLGPAAAGLFKVADSIYNAVGEPASLLRKSFYPAIMRLDPRTREPWRLGIRFGALAGAIGLLMAAVLIVIGQPLVLRVFGAHYGAAYDMLRIMVLALVVSMATFPLESLLYMAKRHRMYAAVEAVTTVIYLALLVGLGHVFGLTGVAIAYVGARVLMAAFCFIPTLSAYRRRAALDPVVGRPH